MDERDDGFDGDRSRNSRLETIVSSRFDGGAPDLDEFLRLLSNRRRRYALYCLRERTPLALEALATRVAAELAGTTPDDVADAHREEVETMLVHAEIPMLTETGIVSYDTRTETLSLDYPPAAIESLLDACAELDGIDEIGCGDSREPSSNDRE